VRIPWVVIFVPLVVGAALIFRPWPWPRHGLDRVHHAVHWPESCAEVSTSGEITLNWSHATKRATIDCEYLGPFVAYARFRTQAELRTDLIHDAPWGATCIAGNEVVVDGLDPGQFDDVCRRLDGHLVDGVKGIPGPPDDSDAAIATNELRMKVSEQLALRDYWSASD
jgi:hypothetical protein